MVPALRIAGAVGRAAGVTIVGGPQEWYVGVTLHRPLRKLTAARLRKSLVSEMEVAGTLRARFPDYVRGSADRPGYAAFRDGMSWRQVDGAEEGGPRTIEVEFLMTAGESTDVSIVATRALAIFRNAVEAIPELNGVESEGVVIDGLSLGRCRDLT